MIAFLIPNKSSELFNYVVSVDLIEQKTELTFPALEDSIEDELERSTERSPLSDKIALSYHSFTLLASIFKNINNRIVKPHNPELHKKKR
jgi:hypothetical protein